MCDIKNHVYKAKRALELSKIDQENLKLKVNKWTPKCSENKFFFLPYIEESSNDEQTTEEKVEGTDHDTFCGNSGDDDNWCEILGCSKQCFQSSLYMHQTPWQQQLLERYGNTISLLDTTYKTTHYELALFFVCVWTNVGYLVVADFITQSEDVEHISEALKQVITDVVSYLESNVLFITDYFEA